MVLFRDPPKISKSSELSKFGELMVTYLKVVGTSQLMTGKDVNQ